MSVKRLVFSAAILLLLTEHPAEAGHEFMAMMRQATALQKAQVCSNDQVKIEYRAGAIMGKPIALILVAFEPSEVSKKSQFYREDRKDFYSLSFYMLSDNEKNITYYMKLEQSGDLAELTAAEWISNLSAADPNAANVLSKMPSDCRQIYPVPAR